MDGHAQPPVCVEVQHLGAARGRGLVASQSFKRGEEILAERPLCCMQSSENRRAAPACAGCKAFVGSLSMQAALLTHSTDGEVTNIENFRVPESDLLVALPGVRDALTEGVFPCAHNCGEVYCSKRCRDDHWRSCHRLLCTGPIEDPEHPLVQFKMHALFTNDIFLLAGEVIARCICQVLETGCTVEEATRPFVTFQSGLWWETSAGGDAEVAQQMMELVKDSLDYFTAALEPHAKTMPLLFTTSFYANIIGAFELNNIGIRVSSPLIGYAKSIAGAPPAVRVAAIERLARLCKDIDRLQEIAREEEEEEEDGMMVETDEMDVADDEINVDEMLGDEPTEENLINLLEHQLTPFDGTGLYAIACMMNHSCVPNVEPLYSSDGRGPVMARVVAKRDIKAGEELCICYIEGNLEFGERQEILNNYGFVCMCERCEAERD